MKTWQNDIKKERKKERMNDIKKESKKDWKKERKKWQQNFGVKERNNEVQLIKKEKVLKNITSDQTCSSVS